MQGIRVQLGQQMRRKKEKGETPQLLRQKIRKARKVKKDF